MYVLPYLSPIECVRRMNCKIPYREFLEYLRSGMIECYVKSGRFFVDEHALDDFIDLVECNLI